MIVLNAFFEVKPGLERAFMDLTKPLIEKTREESGCHFYNLYRSSRQFVFIEHWSNQQALDAHNESSHFKAFVEEATPLFSKDLIINSFTKN